MSLTRKELTEEKKILQSKFEAGKQKIDNYEQKINQLNEYIQSKYQGELDKLVKDKALYQDDKKELEKQLTAERESTRIFRQEADTKQSELNYRIVGLIKDVEHFKEAVEKYEQKSKAYKDYETKIGQLLNENEILVKINGKLSATSNGTDHRNEVERLNREIKIFVDELKKNETENLNLFKLIEKLKEENENMKEHLKSIVSEKLNPMSRLENQNVARLETQVKNYAQNESEYKEYIEALKEKVEKQESIMRTQAQVINELKVTVDETACSSSENESLKSKLKLAERKLIEINGMFEEYDNNFIGLSHKLESVSKQNEELLRENMDLKYDKTTSEKLQLQFENKQKDIKEQFEEKEKTLNREVNTASSKSDQNMRIVLKENDEIHQSNLELRSRLKNLEVL